MRLGGHHSVEGYRVGRITGGPVRGGVAARSLGLPPRRDHPESRVTLRLPLPSQSEGDGLDSDLIHAQSLSAADTARVASSPVT